MKVNLPFINISDVISKIIFIYFNISERKMNLDDFLKVKRRKHGVFLESRYKILTKGFNPKLKRRKKR